MSTFSFAAIGQIHSPYKEKFAVPRQPGLVPAAKAWLELAPGYGGDSLRDLEAFSHLWLIFVFHEHLHRSWQPLVRPPRLGGNAKTGVFASRSTFRPNPLGMSVVELVAIDHQRQRLQLAGVDLVDGTPVLDIKPYLPYADAIIDARAGYAPAPPIALPVHWQAGSLASLHKLGKGHLQDFITQVLAQDPRPAYHHQERQYGVHLDSLNVLFRVAEQGVLVEDVQPFTPSEP
ncbi:tRNA (N6-threonylcarbamoyladenosine(37)-N6)-methyltransferase TrmO [Gallaecimonas sp. GXIMD1310]|uniref:tRNA (N6-threonylcarbamoyladenosine(37)-N6)-methyltransferase TrmO n=1 Tax=Gallaecimonas sp. GXIMD1310 TaxID=3131926 RepID=UPI0032565856